MSMRIVPSGAHPSSFTAVTGNTSAPSAPGVHDTLRHGVGPAAAAAAAASTDASAAAAPTSRHPLEPRLAGWEATQRAARLESLRKTYGMAEPIRREMELRVTRAGEWRPQALRGGSALPSVHEDILLGRDASLDWEDVFTGDETRRVPGVHEEMERKVRM